MKVSEALISQEVVVELKYSHSAFCHSAQQVLGYTFYSTEVIASNCFNTFFYSKISEFHWFCECFIWIQTHEKFFPFFSCSFFSVGLLLRKKLLT